MTCARTAAAIGLPDIFHDGLGYSRVLAGIVAAASQPEQPDAELIDLGTRWDRVIQGWAQLEIDDPHITPKEADDRLNDLSDRESWLTEAISVLPATTPAGLAVKARVLARAVDCNAAGDAAVMAWAVEQARSDFTIERAIGSLVVDLLRLAQGSAR